jgi:hypothetical protein
VKISKPLQEHHFLTCSRRVHPIQQLTKLNDPAVDLEVTHKSQFPEVSTTAHLHIFSSATFEVAQTSIKLSVMSPVAFIIGAGSNVGSAVARRFLKEGYKVAVGARKPDVEAIRKTGLVPVKLDASDQATIISAFAAVEKELGPVNVVVYNGVLYLSAIDLCLLPC